MMARDKKRVLLLGLDEELLWQVTRTLAKLEDRIDICSASDPATAMEICRELYNQAPFHLIIADGWEETWKAGYLLGWDETLRMARGRWIMLVDSAPLEGILDERMAAAATYLEKPFNPKELPGLVTKLLERDDGEGTETATRPTWPPEAESEAVKPPHLPVVPGESYQMPCQSGPDTPGSQEEEAAQEKEYPPPPPASSGNNDFYAFVNKGFECLKTKDHDGAWAHWNHASELRPQDRRLRANLKQLERLISNKPADSVSKKLSS